LLSRQTDQLAQLPRANYVSCQNNLGTEKKNGFCCFKSSACLLPGICQRQQLMPCFCFDDHQRPNRTNCRHRQSGMRYIQGFLPLTTYCLPFSGDHACMYSYCKMMATPGDAIRLEAKVTMVHSLPTRPLDEDPMIIDPWGSMFSVLSYSRS
jgi:hypothetical protein